jgi:nicotinamidase/pyrazinamidase
MMEDRTMEYQDIPYELSATIRGDDALVVVDLQYDFMPGGALPVEDGDLIISGVNTRMQLFNQSGATVVLTQDWHPSGHHSFASSHEGKNPYDLYDAPGLGPVLWPDHCVQGTHGADFHENVNTRLAHATIRKGYHMAIDSYSGFLENDKQTHTGLDGYLKDRNVRRVFVCGLALDYCVFYSAADALDNGYEVYVVIDLTKAVASPKDSVSHALETLFRSGAKFIDSGAIQTESA